MAETEVKFRYDYKDPENVNSKVPEEQKLRESVETSELAVAKSTLNTGDKVENPKDYVLTPVVTVTKNEEIKNGVFVTIKPPVYPEIQSEVIHNPEPIRKMADHSDEDKKRTRIPKLRFRQAVKRANRERRASCEAENGMPKPSYQRRSSIPRLKKFASQVDNDISEKHEITPLDDEFEKIYDEVVTDPVSIDETILNTKVDDPAKVEHNFEEIIHAYDENKVEPISLDKTQHSKIPMLKRSNEHEIEAPKNIQKASEIIPSSERLKVQDVINKYSKIRDNESNSKYKRPIKTDASKTRNEDKNKNESKKVLKEIKPNFIQGAPSQVNKPNQVIHSEVLTYESEGNINNIGKNDIVSRKVLEIVEEKAPIYNETVELLPVKDVNVTEVITTNENVPIEPVKVVSVEEINLITQSLLKNSEYSIQYSTKEETNVTKGDESKVNEEIYIEDANLDNYKLDDTEHEVPLIKGKVSKMIGQLSSNPENTERKILPSEDIPKTKSVLSKIALFERTEPPKSINTHKTLNTKSTSTLTEEDKYMPKVVNGTLKPSKETDNEVNKHKITYEHMYHEENNVIHNITTREVNASSLTVVDTVPKATEIIYDEPTVQKTEPYSNTMGTRKEIEETEIQYIEPYRIEYAHPINTVENVSLEFESKVHPIRISNNNEDVFYVNHKNENSKITDKRLYKSQGELNFHKIESSQFDNQASITKNLESEKIKDDFRRTRSTSEDYRSQKVKSIADIDLGDTIKGKVHNLIVRINSTEKLNVEKKEVISAKERPRKKSVSEKIALFESKFSVATTHSNTRLPTTKQQKTISLVSELPEQELKAKIAELEAAKLKYERIDGSKGIVLANGVEMPALALGTALLDPKLTVYIVSAAIEMGYRAIDTAYIYGNEKEVGEAIRRKIQDGTVKREELFVTSKLWSTFHRTELVEGACRRSLDAMGLEYFDLYLVHSPMSFKEGTDPYPRIANVLQYSSYDYMDAWFGMEQLALRGLATSVGVSNFNGQQLQRLLDKARVKPVVNQVECHPYLSQHKLDEFCAERNIKLMCYGVLGSRSTPAEQRGAYNEVLDDPLVLVMAAGLGITPAQLLIRYHLEQGRGVVVQATTATHLYDNLQALNCTLTEGQVDALSALNRNKRTYTFVGMGDTHKNYPFKAPF